MRLYILPIVLLLLISLLGCSMDNRSRSSVNNLKKLENQQIIQLKDGQQEVRIIQIGKNIKSSIDNNAIIRTIKTTDDNKKAYLMGKIDNMEKLYIFDMESDKLIPSQDSNIIEKETKYIVKSISSSDFEIYDSINKKQLAHFDLSDKEGINKQMKSTIKWSNTEKYIVVEQDLSVKYIFDVTANKEVELPVKEGLILLKWSDNDQKAIIDQTINPGPDKICKTYIWDISENKLTQIGKSFTEELRWTSNCKSVYYIDSGTVNGKSFNNIIFMYNEEKKSWEKVYLTSRTIKDGSIRWISGNEFIYIAEIGETDSSPLANLKGYFAVKYNIGKSKEVVEKIDTNTMIDFVWSYDNNYLYYLDLKNFYKVKLDFENS